MIHHIEGSHVCTTSGVYQPPQPALAPGQTFRAWRRNATWRVRRFFPRRSWLLVICITAVVVGGTLAILTDWTPQL